MGNNLPISSNDGLGYRTLTDVFDLENVIQDVGVSNGRYLIIDTLRDVFKDDRWFHYVEDVFGFPLTRSDLDLDPAVGILDNQNTRIFIGSTYRFDIKFNPAIIVKSTSTQYVPISFNQNFLGIVYRTEIIQDGYGNKTIIDTPAYQTLVGAWNQTFEIKVVCEDPADRDDIVDAVMVALMSTRRLELQNEGLFISNITTTGEVEEPWAADYVYTTAITVNTRSEFRVNIPISSLVDRIMFCFDFSLFSDAFPPVQPKFNINEIIDLDVLLPEPQP